MMKINRMILAAAFFAGAQALGQTGAALTPAQMTLTSAELIKNPEGALSKGTKPFQGISSITCSPKGRVFVVWYGSGGGENNNNYLMLSYSDNRGETWTDVKLVVRSPFCGKVRTFDPALWTDARGRVWLFWAQNGLYDKEEMSHRKHGVWASVAAKPDVKEIEWSAPRRLADGVMMCKPVTLKSGDIIFPIAFWQSSNNDALAAREGAGVYLSKDGGETLSQIGNVRVPDVVFPEHMLVEKKNGDIWLLTRRQPENLKYLISSKAAEPELLWDAYDGIFAATSKDGGRSFGKTDKSKIPHTGSRFYIGRLASGNLLLVKNYAADKEWLEGKDLPDRTKRVPRNKMMAYISKDDGKTWEGGLELDERASVSYPDASQAADGAIFVTYDYLRYKEQEIYAARVHEEDILAGKLVNPDSKLKLLVNKGETEFVKPEEAAK